MLRCLTALLLGLPLLAVAAPDSARYRLDVGVETRLFPHTELDPRQHDAGVSLFALGHADYAWNGGRTKLTASPFARLDSADSKRSHADIRELEFIHRGGNFDYRAGIGKVFWGTTEFVHLVDIINQTDLVENIDGEDKLGQPLLSVAWSSPVGVLSGYLLPWFRERQMPGVRGRLRGVDRYSRGDPLYQSGNKEKHVDMALRWSYSGGSLDIGVAHFAGTAREPRFVARTGGSEPLLVPLYDQIHQTSIDISRVDDGWLWKLEALHQRNRTRNYSAAIGGFEYTFPSSDMESPEIGVLLEYAWDNRPDTLDSAFQNDLFLGMRVSRNDIAGSEFLAGFGQDLERSSRFVSVDASRRIGASGRLALKLRVIDSSSRLDPLFELRRDDHLLIEYTHYL